MKKAFCLLISIVFMFSIFPVDGNIMAESSKSHGWGFKKRSNQEPPDVGKYKEMLEKYGSYYLDQSGDKVVYLTFDNGYEEGYTEEVLDVLKEKQVPAAFFLTGHYVTSSPDLVKRMVQEGHIVGNHSYHHPDFTKVSKKRMKKELDSLEEAVGDITEQDTMKYMRPPKGTFSEQTLNWGRDLGYINVFWSLAFVDWNTDQQQGWKQAYEKILNQMHPGAVILLHTVSKDNAEALEHLIDELRKQGYTFKSLDHLVMKDMLPESIYGR